MKRSLIVIAVMMFFVGNVFALTGAEVNVNVGIQLDSNFKGDTVYNNKHYEAATAFSMGGEFLYSLFRILKIGAGIDFLSQRTIDKDTEYIDKNYNDSDIIHSSNFSFIPIYAIVQLNPILPAKGIFFKNKIGYSFFSITDLDPGQKINGGLVLGVATGYELSSGLIISAAYDIYLPSIYCSNDRATPDEIINITYETITLNLGYKFKL